MAKSRKEVSYLKLHRNGTLQKRINTSRALLQSCTVCPHACRVNRLKGESGLCRTGSKARVASFGAHFGEESPLVGRSGSGTIFFEGCNLLCVFCQNYDISHIDNSGDASPATVSDHRLAEIMINLQTQGCHNINFVTPSHVIPQILAALPFAIEKGLNIPLVYNSGGYDSPDTLHLLEEIIDIYMPDCKFWEKSTAALYTKADNYPDIMQKALKKMHRQVGDLIIDDTGLACRGLLVRHLVMPGHLDETSRILEFLARQISTGTYINIMDQYRPCHRASEFDRINLPLTTKEYAQALATADRLGLHRLDQREWKKFFKLLGL